VNRKREVIVFGYGDLGIAHGAEKGQLNNELIIYRLEKQTLPIGTKLEGDVGKTTDELDTIARWRFENPDSVQVVIDALEIIKERLDEVA